MSAEGYRVVQPLPPRGMKVWWFTARRHHEVVMQTWAATGAHETEAAVFLKMLKDEKYDSVNITFGKSP